MNAIRVAVGLAVVAILAGSALAATHSQPVASTGPVTSVSGTSATLTGTVNPGGKSTTWRFEYGKTASYGSQTGSQSAGNGTADVDVATQVTGLQPGTTYHYRLKATNDDGTATGSDGVFVTTGSDPVATTGSATGIGPRHATLNGTVDPNSLATTYYFEYGSSTSYGKKTASTSAGSGTSAKSVSAQVTGLTPGKTYHFRLVATNASGRSNGADAVFAADPGPDVTTEEPMEVTSSSAVLRGTVDANGRGTTYYFQYGRTRSYGSRTPKMSAGSGNDPVAVSYRITRLRTDRTYHFRLVAENDAGTAKGKDRSFKTTTGPAVETGPASDVSPTTANVTAIVIPGGRSTTVWIEYGTSTRYGSSSVRQGVGSGFEPVSTGFTLTGLRAGVTYHYRARASNSSGRSDGRDATFRTSGGPPQATTSRVTGVGPFSARITGSVDPGGLPTTAYFEYGRSRGYGKRTPDIRLDGTVTRAVAARLAGLQPGRRYYFRLVAASAAGTSIGRGASFGTPPLPRDARGRVVRCTIVGTQWPDVLRGTNGRDVICGFGGNDRIVGRGGNDVVYAGPGDDRVDAGAGNDLVYGGSDRDQLVGGPGNDRLEGGRGADRLFGNAGNDRLVGGPGRDSLVGGTGRDTLLGGADADTIFARDGRADVVDGGRGTDTATLDRSLDRFASIERRRF